MTETKSELEERLLSDPFETETRKRYARMLGEEGHHRESLKQWELLIRQQPRRAGYHLEAALCCQHLNSSDECWQHVARARECDDFDEDDSRLASIGTDPGRKALRVLAGGKRDAQLAEVIPLKAAGRVLFRDVVGMEELKKLIRLRIIEPFVNPGLFSRFKKRSGGGVLLFGPPGCGKTMIAGAIATECNAAFAAVGISEILNMWVGESERNLAAIFEKARSDTPAVLFFDELDALAYSRAKASSDHTRTLVNEFLSQLDGLAGNNEKVLILAATNMPWDVDEAMKRPGRFDRQIFVPPPDDTARAEMFRIKLEGIPLDAVDFAAIGRSCERCSGADIDGIVEYAKELVLADIMATGEERNLREADLLMAASEAEPTTLEWLKTARNLVKYGGARGTYKDVEKYLRKTGLY